MDEATRTLYWNQGNLYRELWTVQARQLAYAAQVLYRRYEVAAEILFGLPNEEEWVERGELLSEMSLHSTAMMLAGYATENALKGIRIEQMNAESPMVENDPRIRDLTSTHNLVQIAATARIAVTEVQSVLLQSLTDYVLWSGRYPRPRRPAAFLTDDLQHARLDLSQSPGEWGRFVEFFNMLVALEASNA